MTKQPLRKELGITSRKISKMLVGSALPRFEDYGTTNSVQYQVEKPEYFKNLVLPDEPKYDYDEQAETVLGQQTKNAINQYYNEREQLLFDKVPYSDKYSLESDRLNTKIKIGRRNNEYHTDSGNMGNNKPSRSVLKQNPNIQDLQGNFNGTNYNANNSKSDYDKNDITNKQYVTSIKNHKTNGLASKKTLNEIAPAPTNKNYYQQALKHYNNGNAFYMKPKRGSPEHAEVIKIMAKLKQG
jgi:hypothetical protein